MDDNNIRVLQPGYEGTEKITVAAGTKFQMNVTFQLPHSINDGNALLFRALIEEIKQLRELVEQHREDFLDEIRYKDE